MFSGRIFDFYDVRCKQFILSIYLIHSSYSYLFQKSTVYVPRLSVIVYYMLHFYFDRFGIFCGFPILMYNSSKSIQPFSHKQT